MTRLTRTSLLAPAIVALLAGALLAGDALNAQGISRLNRDAQELWEKDGLPLLRPMAMAELQKLVGVPHPAGKHATATITRIKSLTLDVPTAPGLRRCDGSAIVAAIPREGCWDLGVRVDVHVKGKVLGVKVDRTYDVGIELDRFQAELQLDLDSTDPAAPTVVRVRPPKVDFKLKVKSSNWLLGLLTWITRPLMNGVARVLVKVGAEKVAGQVTPMVQAQPVVIGDAGGAGLDPVPPANLEDLAVKLEADTYKYRVPYGTVWERISDKDYLGTWEESLNDPTFDAGVLDKRATGPQGDSALMTGHLLAGHCYRWALTGSPEALDHARGLLRSFRTLLTMKGEPGNLNRTICPMSPEIDLDATTYAQVFQGTEYVMSDYISRDAYMGTFFGLSVAHSILASPADKAEAGALLEMAIDYLLRNHWTWRKRDGSIGERWQGTLEHQYAWVLAAYAVNPQKYAALLQDYAGYSDLMWVGVWTGVADPIQSYYGFNLLNGVLHTALEHEHDPVRWQRAYRGMAVMRRFIGHHQNAHFNNSYGAADPASLPRLAAENEVLLTRWMRMKRRFLIGDLTNDPTIEKITVALPIPKVSNASTPFQQTMTIARQPIPLEKRLSTGFRWSRSPVRLSDDYIGTPEPNKEGEGVDFVLPYWMSRYYGLVR